MTFLSQTILLFGLSFSLATLAADEKAAAPAPTGITASTEPTVKTFVKTNPKSDVEKYAAAIVMTAEPDCKYRKPPNVDWEVAVCAKGEKNFHYLTEFRFKKAGKIFMKYSHLDNPTGGVPQLEFILAEKDYAIALLGGDENGQLVGWNIKQKKLLISTGKILGIGACALVMNKPISADNFCSVNIECEYPFDEVKGHKFQLSEFLCRP